MEFDVCQRQLLGQAQPLIDLPRGLVDADTTAVGMLIGDGDEVIPRSTAKFQHAAIADSFRFDAQERGDYRQVVRVGEGKRLAFVRNFVVVAGCFHQVSYAT